MFTMEQKKFATNYAYRYDSIEEALSSASVIAEESSFRGLQLKALRAQAHEIVDWIRRKAGPNAWPRELPFAGEPQHVNLALPREAFAGLPVSTTREEVIAIGEEILKDRWERNWPHLTPSSEPELIPGVVPSLPYRF